MLSIVVPALDEAPNLERLLPDLVARCPREEVIVVDGGSADATAEVVRCFPSVRFIASPRGRALFGSAQSLMITANSSRTRVEVRT